MKEEIDISAIYGYYHKPFIQQLRFKLLIASAVIALLVLTVIYLRRMKKNKKSSPWDQALQQLESLKNNQWNTKEDLKRFYYSLTHIIKQYLKERFGWKTPAKTDEELITYLKERKFNETLLTSLQLLLERAVWIKFADQDILKTHAQKDLQIAKNIILKTIPHEK